MPVNYFFLAPAVILLLSAFVLSFVTFRLPDRWQNHRAMRYFLAPSLVGLAGLLLLGISLTSGKNATGEGSQLSAWNFSAEGTGAVLTSQADELSLPFLILTLLILLIVMLTSLPITRGAARDGY